MANRIRSTVYMDKKIREKVKVFCTYKNVQIGDLMAGLFELLLSNPDSKFEAMAIKKSIKNKCIRIEERVQKIKDKYKIEEE